jgi:hypothetical protein
MERGADPTNKNFSDIKALQGLLTHVTFGCCNQTQVRVSPTNPTNLKYLGENKMKSIKYTLAALAVIALASVSTAKAQDVPGDYVLGAFNATNSLEFDLGSSLANGETWNLGNVTSLAGTGLDFSIVAASEKNFTEGSLPKNTLAVAGVNVASVSVLPLSTVNTLEESVNQGTLETPASSNILDEHLQSNANQSDSYANLDTVLTSGTSFGLGYDIDQVWTGSDSASLFTLTPNGTPVEIGTFSTSTVGGITTLTFDTVAAPEPSAYALGLCAVALFFVLKRRRSVA